MLIRIVLLTVIFQLFECGPTYLIETVENEQDQGQDYFFSPWLQNGGGGGGNANVQTRGNGQAQAFGIGGGGIGGMPGGGGGGASVRSHGNGQASGQGHGQGSGGNGLWRPGGRGGGGGGGASVQTQGNGQATGFGYGHGGGPGNGRYGMIGEMSKFPITSPSNLMLILIILTIFYRKWRRWRRWSKGVLIRKWTSNRIWLWSRLWKEIVKYYCYLFDLFNMYFYCMQFEFY